MEGFQFISSLRFSMQLLMAEALFVWTWKRKKYFPIRMAAGVMGYLTLAWIVFHAFIAVSGRIPVLYDMV